MHPGGLGNQPARHPRDRNSQQEEGNGFQQEALEDRPCGGDFLQAWRHQGLPTLSGRLRNAKRQGFLLDRGWRCHDAYHFINIQRNLSVSLLR